MRRLTLTLMSALFVPSWAIACIMPEGWSPMTPEDDFGPEAAFFVASQPAPVSHPFDAKIWICSDKAPQSASVAAIMPAHQHGMNYRPTLSGGDDGVFVASGMVFHMPGQWRVDVAVQIDSGIVRFSSELIAR